MPIEKNRPGGDAAINSNADDNTAETGNTPASGNPGYHPIQFKGHAREYFGIWLTTLLLTVITLGIYGPWAKVRRKNYFHNNTAIHGYGFGYHATGWQILKGRVLILLMIGLANVAGYIDPYFTIATALVFFFLIPWALNRSLRFNARNTSWRNVRLQWHGTYGGMMVMTYLVPLVSILSAGFLMPVMSRLSLKYFTNKHHFGTMPFEADMELGQAYTAFFCGILLAFVVLLAMLAPAYAIPRLFLSGDNQFIESTLGILTMIPIFFFVFAITFQAMCRNYMLQNLHLGSIARFDSSINPVVLVWIMLSNVVVVILTLGMMVPWAYVRLYDYFCSHTEYAITGDINSFIDVETRNQGAFGEEFADMEGLEFGF